MKCDVEHPVPRLMVLCVAGSTGRPAVVQEALQESHQLLQAKPQQAVGSQQADTPATAPSPEPLFHSPPDNETELAEAQEAAAEEELNKEDPYESPDWDPQQIDLLGERLTAAEERELRALEEQSDQPGYMQKVDMLIASKLISHGIATHDQLFKGTVCHASGP